MRLQLVSILVLRWCKVSALTASIRQRSHVSSGQWPKGRAKDSGRAFREDVHRQVVLVCFEASIVILWHPTCLYFTASDQSCEQVKVERGGGRGGERGWRMEDTSKGGRVMAALGSQWHLPLRCLPDVSPQCTLLLLLLLLFLSLACPCQ